MAKKSKTQPSTPKAKSKPDAPAAELPPFTDTRHPAASRKNNPPAKIAAEGSVPLIPKATYAYNPHLPPVLRFDQRGKPDSLPALLEKAKKGPLTNEETALIAAALRSQEPWLEWTGKREKPDFSVDPVALHIHERVSAQAILKIAARQDVDKFLFADPEQEYHDAVQFYKHDVDWSNRLILGDSLQVMSSLARREDLAGKVQMIYMDPPYGIKFASNFQPEVGKRDVKDKQEDLTREPEMVRAYRDTWHLGIHSYLTYLRDRLIVARELLADTGSIFVQISHENIHHIREVMDEVFGRESFVAQVVFLKSSATTSEVISAPFDYLVWYCRDQSKVRYRPVFSEKQVGGEGADYYTKIMRRDGTYASLGDTSEEEIAAGVRVYRPDNLVSQGFRQFTTVPFEFEGETYHPGAQMNWKTTIDGMRRLAGAERVEPRSNSLSYRRFLEDFPVSTVTAVWDDTVIAGRPGDKVYVVQTGTKVIERCMLMTTDPGDLVLDPTCGSGTTAYVAEQWGRRWITADTSRVAVAIARQRILTAKFDLYKTRGTGTSSSPASGFIYKTVPHITLKSIAQNVALDPIFARHEPILDKALAAANAALAKLPKELVAKLSHKLATKEKTHGKKSITDADRRRWLLPSSLAWQHWQVPFDTDTDYPKTLAEAVTAYRAAWRAKMDDVNNCINASAEQEELVDQPEIVKNVVRVSGPFSVEAVKPPEMSLGDIEDGGFDGAPESVSTDVSKFSTPRFVEAKYELEVANISAYLDQMLRYLRADGVRFLNNQQMKWTRLESLFDSGTANPFHAEGRWTKVGETDPDPDGRANVAVAFGPQYGPVTGSTVVELVRQAHIRGYDHIVIAGFNFDGAAQTTIEKQSNLKVKAHLAHIRPDINPGMNGLLKETPKAGSGQLFTVFGQPRITIKGPIKKSQPEEGMYTVSMDGVDIYDPARDSISSSGADKVAAWFLDSDYDGRTFCITQAFFPDRGAWEKLQKALNGKDGVIDAERFEALSGTTSLAFPKGKHACIAVKVIDPRGNEVMAVEKL